MAFWRLAFAMIVAGALYLSTDAAKLARAEADLRPVALGFHVPRQPVALTEVRVYDGDTIDAGLERFRLDGLDTPELGDKAHCALELQRAAFSRDFARRLFSNARQIVATPTETRRDRYARVVARITVDGRDYTQLMIENGAGRAYLRPPGWNWCVTPVAPCAANGASCGRGPHRAPSR